MRRELTELARREGMSVNQFIGIAVAEKIARLEVEAAPSRQPLPPPPPDHVKLN
jgi:hypothetical protein